MEVDSHELGSFLGPMRMWGMKKEKEKIRSVGVVHDQREEVLKAQFSCRTSRRAPDLGVQALPAPASHQRIELKSRKSGQVFAGSFIWQ